MVPLSDIIRVSGKGNAKFAVLIDPDKHTPQSLKKIKGLSIEAGADLFLFGGSLLHFISAAKAPDAGGRLDG